MAVRANLGLKVREDEREIVMSSGVLGAIITALFGSAFVYIGAIGKIPSPGKWIFMGVGGLFAVLGLVGAFYRFHLTLDLFARRYTLRKGFWPNVRATQGSFDDIEHVRLTREVRRSSGKSQHEYDAWVIYLPFPGDEPVTLAEYRDEAEAYRRWEALARKLRRPAADFTDAAATRVRNYDELDQPVARRPLRESRSGFSSDPGPPPRESNIQLLDEPLGRTILLPPSGFNIGVAFLVVFGLFFGGFAAFAFFAAISGGKVTGSRTPLYIIPPIFMLIGSGIVFVGLMASRMREFAREEGGSLAFGVRFVGREWGVKHLAKNEIEALDIRAARISSARGGGARIRVGGVSMSLPSKSSQPGTEVFVRADRAVVRMGDRLPPAAQQWLCDTLLAWLARS